MGAESSGTAMSGTAIPVTPTTDTAGERGGRGGSHTPDREPGRCGASVFADLVNRDTGDRPGNASAVGPFAEPGRGRQAVPFVAALVAGFATVALPPAVRLGEVAVAAGITAALAAAVWVVPWRRLPVWAQGLPVLGLYPVVALLRDASGGAASPFTPMALLPLIWLALYHGWGLVLAGLAAAELMLLGPLLLIGDADYPLGEWRRAIIMGAVGTTAAVSTKLLVSGARADARRLATASALAHRQQEFAEAVLDSANTLILVVDTAGRVVAFNKACETVSGYRADELIGRRAWHVLAPREDRPALSRLFDRRAAAQAQAPPGWEQHTEPYEVEWIARNGRRPRIRWTDSAIRDERGRLTHLVATGVDVTEQRNAEELVRHLLAAATEQALIGTDLDGVITVFNAGAERLLGYRTGDVVGRHTPELFHDPVEVAEVAAELGVPAGFEVFPALARHHPDTRQWTFICQDGTRRRAELTVSVIRDGSNRPIGYLGVGRDVTAEQHAQAALRAAYERERASAQRLRELDRARTEFIAAASHDLRTPLTSIMAYHELLLDPAASALGPDDRDMLIAAHRNARRLLALVTDLLVISKIDAGTFTVERRPVEVEEIINGALDTIEPGIVDRDLVIQVTLPPERTVVSADLAHMERALINLIGNAVKFTPDGGRVRVAATAAPDRVTIQVSDSGVGIPPDELPRVFQRFFRSTRTQHTVSGTGLGLAITKAIVDAHRGDIAVESEPGHGTTVTITLTP